MSLFIAVVTLSGEEIPQAYFAPYERKLLARGLDLRRHVLGSVAVLTSGAGMGTSMFAGTENWSIAGCVRLDNRAELLASLPAEARAADDLRLAGHAVQMGGWQAIPGILGDFGFLTWCRRTRSIVAASDAIGVRRLYWTRRGDVLAFASRAEALALGDEYDLQYLAERVASSQLTVELTAYKGVSAIAPGHILLLGPSTQTHHKYWSPWDYSDHPLEGLSEQQAAETCRDLLATAVKSRLEESRNTWAQLSGGMDSSSVVSVAQWLASRGEVRAGLTGTFTYIDLHGSGGDERRYATAVADLWKVDQEVIDCSPLRNDPIAFTATDEPSGSLETLKRDYSVCDLLGRHGARVVLTGAGGDVLFGGTMFFFADWVVNGRIGAAVSEMTRRAVLGRASFWELAYRNALLPLLPRVLRRHLIDEWGQVPAWLKAAAIKRYDLRDRAVTSVLYDGRLGHKYGDAAAQMVAMIPTGLTRDVIEEAVDMRHPYYHRPLVEFALRLSPDLCVRPHARKWVLRQAMSGILPEMVRERIGKGSYDGAISWWLAAKREGLERMTKNSILVELGLVDAPKLRAALTTAIQAGEERTGIGGAVLATLSIEGWLQARSGRWPRGPYRNNSSISLNYALPA